MRTDNSSLEKTEKMNERQIAGAKNRFIHQLRTAHNSLYVDAQINALRKAITAQSGIYDICKDSNDLSANIVNVFCACGDTNSIQQYIFDFLTDKEADQFIKKVVATFDLRYWKQGTYTIDDNGGFENEE